MPELNGWQINCWRGLWMSVGLLVYLIITYGRDTLSVFLRVPRGALILSALFFAVGTTCYVTSLTMVNTATVAVIGATSPLVTGLLSPWITGERPGVLAWISAGLAALGMYFIAANGFEMGHVTGLLFSLCVPLTFALQTLMLRRYREFEMMPAICVGGFLAFVAAGFFSQLFPVTESAFNVSFQSFLLLLLMGPVQLSIPLIFYGMGARSVPAVTLALISMLDAVINPFWSWLFVGEIPDLATLKGGSIILLAIAVCLFGGRFLPKPAPTA